MPDELVETIYDESTNRLVVRAELGTSIEDYEDVMAAVIDKLIEIKRLPRLVALGEAREYEYSTEETRLLLEIANAISRIGSEEIIKEENVIKFPEYRPVLSGKISLLQNILKELRSDPVNAYKTLLREMRYVRIKLKRLQEGGQISEMSVLPNPEILNRCLQHYLDNVLIPMKTILNSCRLLSMAKELRATDRGFYRKIFHPMTRPTFMFTRFNVLPKPNAELIERYNVGETVVQIFSLPGSVRRLYHIMPPEFRLRDDDYLILDEVRRSLGRHEPKAEELAQPEKFREDIFNIALDMIRDIVRSRNLMLPESHMKRLANIMARYTAGLGILEAFLADDKLQDILINSPIGQAPIFLLHADHQECETNIFPSVEDGESWATRFRLQSGRPLDEANPVLDTEISVPGGRSRVAAITRPLSPEGLGFAFRRFRDKPWTLPLFIKAKMIDPFGAGLLWFLVDGSRTMLIAGTRGSGKTSFLGALMTQIMPKIRVITVEDTLELPVTQLRDVGFNIERLKSRSVITHIETELPAEEALRTALRLGDSALILGEVRSVEALALYEAMRIGALANVVAGTIHGESAYGVFDRVVHDLGVPPTSFKATDIIMICNVLRSPDMMHMFRRVTEITEVRKHWKDDPAIEGGFVPLMEYSAKDDILKPTKTFLMGESEVLSGIANRVKEWRANWSAVWDNINLRARVLQTIVDLGKIKPDIMEANYVMSSNSEFHIISDEVKTEIGALDSEMIYERWLKWMKTQL